MEITPPLTEEEYARVCTSKMRNSTEYQEQKRVVGEFIRQNGFDTRTVDVLSIGAGRGNFEKELVEEQGMKMGYICAIEPNPHFVPLLKAALKSLEVEYDVLQTYFTDEFAEIDDQKFDLVIFIHSLYSFSDPVGAVFHATKFLKPGGKILITVQGRHATAAIFTYLLENSDPAVFSKDKTIGDHSVTGDAIISGLRKRDPALKIDTNVMYCYYDVTEFARKSGAPGSTDHLTFSSQADYSKLSERAREDIYEIVMGRCHEGEGRVWWEHEINAVVVSAPEEE